MHCDLALEKTDAIIQVNSSVFTFSGTILFQQSLSAPSPLHFYIVKHMICCVTHGYGM